MRTLEKQDAVGARLFAMLFIAACSVTASGQTQGPAQRNRIQLSVERWKQNEWRVVDAQVVFKRQDHIRFRFRSSLSAYLYILNHASGGQISWLYPVPGKSSTRLESGREVIIPSAEGFYAVGGEPGFDTLYWILRTSPIAIPDINNEQLDAPPTLISRCREEEAQNESACVDKEAGPKAVTDPRKLQAALGLSNYLIARDLTFESKPQATEIGTDSDGSSSGIIYEVRIAHD